MQLLQNKVSFLEQSGVFSNPHTSSFDEQEQDQERFDFDNLDVENSVVADPLPVDVSGAGGDEPFLEDVIDVTCDEGADVPTTSKKAAGILDLLGEGESPGLVSPEVDADIPSRWEPILRKGLNVERRKTLLEKYPLPQNFGGLAPPKLNLEVKEALNAQVVRRDQRLLKIQEQLGVGLSALATVVSGCLKQLEEKEVDEVTTRRTRHFVEAISDASQLFADVFHNESLSRRQLVLINLDEQHKGVLADSPITELLFGEKLDERVSAAKNLRRFSQTLKVQQKPQTISRHLQKGAPSKHLNFRGPSSSRQGPRQDGRAPLQTLRIPNQRRRYPQTNRSYLKPQYPQSQSRYQTKNRMQ